MFSLWRWLVPAAGRPTSRRAAEQPLLDRKSTEWLARIAHEAWQPLSAARTALELIRRSPDDDQRDHACLVLERQLKRLTRLFDDLLEESRLQLGRTTLRVEKVDFRSVVAEITDSIRPQAVAKYQDLVTLLPENPVWIDGDPVRLQQVVSNLLVNAIRYTDRGGQVSVHLSYSPGGAVLTVSDNGRGISPDVLPHIFEPFMRGDDGSEQGLGIGLAIARQLVELHGGTIYASSTGLGNGSEFVVALPAHPSKRCGALINRGATATSSV